MRSETTGAVPEILAGVLAVEDESEEELDMEDVADEETLKVGHRTNP